MMMVRHPSTTLRTGSHQHRHYRYFKRKRPFNAKTARKAPTFAVAEIARLHRENQELREQLADVRCLVNDFVFYRTPVEEYVKLVVLLRGLVKRG